MIGVSRECRYPLIAFPLTGAMRRDIRHPEKRPGGRFILDVGQDFPFGHCTLAVLNEALRVKRRQIGDERYRIPDAGSGRCTGSICWTFDAATDRRAAPRWKELENERFR
jgi:hypothetical protein